jgi:hypothetical protein
MNSSAGTANPWLAFPETISGIPEASGNFGAERAKCRWIKELSTGPASFRNDRKKVGERRCVFFPFI